MIGSVEFEMTRLNAKLRQLEKETGAGGKALVTDAAKAATRAGIEMNPPGWHGVSAPAAKKRGEKTLTRDIRRVFATASYAFGTIKDKAKAKAFWARIRGKNRDLAAAREILRLSTWNSLLKSAEIVDTVRPSEHDSARRRGRVPKKTPVAQIITKVSTLNAYIKERSRMVGLWSAGWMPAVTKLKITRIPAWVARHKGKARGRCEFKQNGDRFEITIANSTGFGSLKAIIPYALAAATAGLDARLKKMKAAALKKSGFNTR